MSETVNVGVGWPRVAFVLLTAFGAVDLVGARRCSLVAVGRSTVDIALTRAGDRAASYDRPQASANEIRPQQVRRVRSGGGPSGRPARHRRTSAYRTGRHRLANFGIGGSGGSSSRADLIGGRRHRAAASVVDPSMISPCRVAPPGALEARPLTERHRMSNRKASRHWYRREPPAACSPSPARAAWRT